MSSLQDFLDYCMTGYDRIINQINGSPIDRLPLMPITMMFAARLAGVPYRTYATDYQTLADAQIRTAETFDFDYVSVISDPAREAADCGADVEFFDDQPPALNELNSLLSDKTALANLTSPDPLGGGRMHDRIKGVARLSERIGNDLLVEGWIEGPCAQGADLRGINHLMMDFIDDPAFVTDLFDFVLDMEVRFAKEQINAGADLIGIGDAAASLVGPHIYSEVVWGYEKRMVDAIHDMGIPVRLHICGNTNHSLEKIGTLGCDIVDLDYPVSIIDARAAMGPDQILLGNLNPVTQLKDSTPEAIIDDLQLCIDQAGHRYIIGAGCEIPPDTPHENVYAMANVAKCTKLELQPMR